MSAPYELVPTTQFQKELKLMKRRKKRLEKLQAVLEYLQAGVPLPSRYKGHPLKGNWQGYRDCHIEPDWLLIYKIDNHRIYLADMGSHSDLFGK